MPHWAQQGLLVLLSVVLTAVFSRLSGRRAIMKDLKDELEVLNNLPTDMTVERQRSRQMVIESHYRYYERTVDRGAVFLGYVAIVLATMSGVSAIIEFVTNLVQPEHADGIIGITDNATYFLMVASLAAFSVGGWRVFRRIKRDQNEASEKIKKVFLE